MRRYGLIGYPLSHSFSKKYFEEKFVRENIHDCVYDLFPLESIEQFPSLINAHPDLRGLNVTIPYKEKVIQYLDELDCDAKAIGAVNCIKISDGKLIGYNTDWLAFEKSLRAFLKSPSRDLVVFVLGT